MNDSIESMMAHVLTIVKPHLSEADYAAAVSYVEQNEYHVAFEHICEQLYADNAPITTGIYKSLEELGHMLGYTDDSHWRELVPLVNA